MKPKHTPGPWKLEITPFMHGKNVAVTARASSIGKIIPSFHQQDGEDVALANARLIAASPDLLAALKELEEQARNAAAWVPHALLIQAVEQAQRVIAKAEGSGE